MALQQNRTFHLPMEEQSYVILSSNANRRMQSLRHSFVHFVSNPPVSSYVAFHVGKLKGPLT